MRCEDYPCCGHTDGLGCDWTKTSDEHTYDYNDTDSFGTPWCDDCDNYATCGDYMPDGAPTHQWQVTEPPEVYME